MKYKFYYADGKTIRLDQFNFFTFEYTNKTIEILGYKNHDDEEDDMTIIESLSLTSYHESFENPTYDDFQLVFNCWCEIHLGQQDTWNEIIELIKEKNQFRKYLEKKSKG